MLLHFRPEYCIVCYVLRVRRRNSQLATINNNLFCVRDCCMTAVYLVGFCWRSNVQHDRTWRTAVMMWWCWWWHALVTIERTFPGKCNRGGGAVEGARQAGFLEGEVLVLLYDTDIFSLTHIVHMIHTVWLSYHEILLIFWQQSVLRRGIVLL